MSLRIAYLAGGKIHVTAADGTKTTFSSKFGEQIRDRAVRANQRNDWKRTGRGASFAGAMIAGAADDDPAQMRIAISQIARGREPDEILYVLETNEISGVFALDLKNGAETRLLHTSDYRISALAVGSEGIACALRGKAGTSNIAVMHLEGSEPQLITEGDSVDLCPVWDPCAPRELLFQSAGTARDAQGYTQGLGPAAIQRLRIESAQLDTVLQSTKHDYLAPRLSREGVLYAVRRPFRSATSGGAWWRIPLDILLVPWRLLQAIFGWLNFFSARYSGRTLMSGGPDRNAPDVRWLTMMGNVVDASERARRERQARGDDGYVPSDWELIALEADGAVSIKAKSVGSFDFAEDGSIVFTDGASVYQLGKNGERTRVLKDDMIEQVLAI